MPLTLEKPSVWQDEDANGEILPLNGHDVLDWYQPHITKALEIEHAIEDPGGKLDKDTPAGRVISACTRIYRYPVGSREHREAAQDLINNAPAMLM